ncbi:MAG TPA: hypothetical protein VFX49_11025 [Chloroflexota bacterium]|nr:hypothetical protein [Chloroflexota bacterium]
MTQMPEVIQTTPANRVRSIMRLFASDVEDKRWYHDRDEWERYLDFIAATHWSRVQLAFGLSYDFPRGVRDSYLYFTYPFLVDVPGFNVRVTDVSSAERERNLATLRFISDACAARGLEFQLGLWTHQYQLFESPEANHRIEGLDEESHAPYCRAAVAQLLRECPAVTGVTLRVHGESGVAEGSHDFWSQVFAGIAESGRRVGIDLHAKGIEQPLIDRALATGLPVTVSPKYWAEHMGPPYHQAAIRPLEHAGRPGNWEGNFMTLSTGSRRFTRYGYADLLSEDRKHGIVYRIWPGTQRLLLWGDPAMAAGYGRLGSFGGADGVEVFEPLSFKGRRGSGLPGPRSGYADASLRHPEGDWAKYKRTYRLFGALLRDPDAPPETWREHNLEELGADGDAGVAAETALAYASRILPLVTAAHLPSAANNTFWAELYTNQPIVEDAAPHPYRDTPEPRVFGTVSPLDPQLFTNPEQFADEVISGQRSGKYSPLDVARRLDALAAAAIRVLPNASGVPAARRPDALRRLAHDVRIVCGVGRFYAAKLRAAVAYALHTRRADPGLLAEGVRHYEAAIAAWTEAADAASVYVDDLSFGPEPKLRGHWRDRLPAMEADLAALRDRLPAEVPPAKTSIEELATPPDVRAVTHQPPDGFARGRAVPLRIEADAPVARLHFRHVNQAESWRSVEMSERGGTFSAEIPAGYTDSPYPLQYYFEVAPASARPWLYPGLDDELANQPYFVLTSRRAPG